MKNVRVIIGRAFLLHDMRRNKIILYNDDNKLYGVKEQMLKIKKDIRIKTRPILVQYQWQQ